MFRGVPLKSLIWDIRLYRGLIVFRGVPLKSLIGDIRLYRG